MNYHPATTIEEFSIRTTQQAERSRQSKFCARWSISLKSPKLNCEYDTHTALHRTTRMPGADSSLHVEPSLPVILASDDNAVIVQDEWTSNLVQRI